MASTLSQAQRIKQFVSGVPKQETQQEAHLLDTLIWVYSVDILTRMASTSSAGSHDQTLLDVWNAITGETARQALFTRTHRSDHLCGILMMASTSSQVLGIKQFVCGTP